MCGAGKFLKSKHLDVVLKLYGLGASSSSPYETLNSAPCRGRSLQSGCISLSLFLSMKEVIDFYEPVRQLRSSSQGLLYCHRPRTVSALRGFKQSSVAIRNNLPIVIHQHHNHHHNF